MPKTVSLVDIHLGNRLQTRRLSLGLTQSHIARQLGVAFQQVQKYEKGINRISSSRLFEMARILNVPITYFFEGLALTQRARAGLANELLLSDPEQNADPGHPIWTELCMKKDLDHLPARKQRELGRVVKILHAEFVDALALKTSEWKRQGRILRIILFGSYARDNWVDEPHTAKGYQSDFDILIIVSHEKLTDIADYWYKAEDHIMRAPGIKTPVNFIVQTLSEVNSALGEGQYFFSDIVSQGIELYNLKGSRRFIEPQPLTQALALKTAKKHFSHWTSSASNAIRLHTDSICYSDLRDAAFLLHQAVERLYTCMLLVMTNYSPNSHNIKFLRSLCEGRDARLIEAWPRETKKDRARFELLKRAYVEARYSEHYTISIEELAWLSDRATALQAAVETICTERLQELEGKVTELN